MVNSFADVLCLHVSAYANTAQGSITRSANVSDNDESAVRLRAARERAGLSQREAAKVLGVHYGSLNRYEQGKMRVPADLLTRAESLPDKPTDPDLEAPNPKGGPGIPMVSISRDAAMFWRGRLVEQVNTLRGVTDSMHALLRMLETATDGVQSAVESDVLPPPRQARPTKAETLSVLAAAGIRPPEAPPTAASDR
jgi:DNA-binding XRE family transcriptional regulator